MSEFISSFNKFRAAVDILEQGKDLMLENLADEILNQSEELLEGGFLFQEFVENQGARVHFLCLLLAQLEQAAETFEEQRAREQAPPATSPKKRRKRPRTSTESASKEIPKPSHSTQAQDEVADET